MNHQHYILPQQQIAAAKARGGGARLPVTAQGAPALLNALTPGAVVNFDGIVFNDSGVCGGWIPADQALAVGDGSNPIVQVVNECLSVYNLSGTRLLGPVALGAFFGQRRLRVTPPVAASRSCMADAMSPVP